METLKQKLASLSPEQRALLERKLKVRKQQDGEKSTPPPIVHRQINGPRPLSLDQERLWFIAQFAPDNAAYNINAGTHLYGRLNVDLLEQSINEVIKRHEALRSTFIAQNGEPRQVVAPELTIQVEQVDVHHFPAEQREAEAERHAAEFAARSFDLQRGPLVRYLVIKLAPTDHILVSVLHHIITDWWSSQIIFDEITSFYNAFVANRPPQVPDLPFQFTDFVLWEREFIQSGALAPSLAYWRKKLAGGTFRLDLPMAQPRPATARFVGRRQWLRFSPELIRGLRQLSQRENTTLFTVLTAAYKTLLFRYTGQTDITMGGPLADRTQQAWEKVVGFMITMLVYHTELTGDISFKTLLGRVRNTILEAYTHKDVPFGELMKITGVERNWGRNPLFQHSFIFLNLGQWQTVGGASGGVTFETLQSEHIDYDPQVSRFDTTLTIWEMDDAFRAYIEYDADLYSAADMQRFADHFETLLTAIVVQPDLPIGQLPLLTTAERQQIIVDWNQTQTAYPCDKSIVQLFEEQVERTPEAVAVDFGFSIFDFSLAEAQSETQNPKSKACPGRRQNQRTYRQLNERANQLAHYLRSRGVRANQPVAICMEQSLEMVIGTLAILKAGGGYVPLNPDYPRERLAFMLEDTQATVLLTTTRLADKLPDYPGETICLDQAWSTIQQASVKNLGLPIAPEDLAYVIYTSGSTGQPKGIAIPHQAVIRLLFNTTYIDLQPADRVAQASNFAFDAITFELWGALLHGGRLVQVDQETLLSPSALAAHIRQQRITVLFLTTALLNQVAQAEPTAFAPLRYLLFGGEAVNPEWVRTVLQQGAPQHLLHVYGPTESTTYATWYEVKEVPAGAKTIPIGYPLSNTTTYILNAQREPVPQGVPGELYIGGDGLALGYLNRPALNAEKFVTAPCSPNPTARLYRTGDWVRAQPDGAIEFIGRIDNQVKIRGFRIEPDEVNHVLSQHETVRNSFVMVREDDTLGRHLVAYVVLASASSDIKTLKAFMRAKLPDYMVPATFVVLDQLPLNANGKVDRKSLPIPTPTPALRNSSTTLAEQTPIQAQVAAIWSTILACDAIGPQDNFFDLGGHSLLAIRLISEIESQFGRRLPLSTLFQHPTVAQLAELLEPDASSAERRNSRKGGIGTTPTVVALQPNGSRVPLICVPGAGGHPFYLWELAQALGNDQPFYGLQTPGLEDHTQPLASMEELVTFFLTALDGARFTAPYWLGGHSSGAIIAFALALALEQRGASVPALVLLDVDAPGQIAEYHFAEAEVAWDDWETLGALVPIVQGVKYRLGDRLPLSLDHLQTLSGAAAMQYVTAAYKAAHLLPAAAGIEQIQRMTAVSSSTLRAIENFRPATKYQGQLLLLHAQDGETLDATRMAQGWQKFCTQPVWVQSVPGNHLTMNTAPHVQTLAAQIRQGLEQ